MINNYIIAPVLIPNKKIIRNANNIINETHQIYFTEETIEQIRNDFHNNNCENLISINHNKELFGLKLTKSFLVNEKNKKYLPTKLLELPIGTWIIEYIVENEVVLQMIKEGKLNGLSLEGIFQYDQEIEINELTDSIKVIDDEILDKRFDEILFQISKGNNQKEIDRNYFFSEFENIKEWKSKFGYKFSIYGNDHFINKKPHFHFDNKQDNLYCKISFDAEIFEIKYNKKLSKGVYKELKTFLSRIENQILLKEMWNKKNPTLNVE